MRQLPKNFDHREALVARVRLLAPWSEGECSPIVGGRRQAEIMAAAMQPRLYDVTRNDGDGAVTRLSPYIHHGILSLNEVREAAIARCDEPTQIKKFLQELAWRDFWQRVLSKHPHWAWSDAEPYKTGFTSQDYADELPADIATGHTGVACIDAFIQELLKTGYVHNHARMYLASYIIHFRRIKWQSGARWFLRHLLDGDLASNNLSWQWVASTFSQKPYVFNLENVHRYFGNLVNTAPHENQVIDASYEDLQRKLFPNLEGKP
jgi:deoxyribodipyrimidine photo-lyase